MQVAELHSWNVLYIAGSALCNLQGYNEFLYLCVLILNFSMAMQDLDLPHDIISL